MILFKNIKISATMFLFIFLRIFLAQAYAQSDEISIETLWDSNIGSTTIDGLAQDESGFIWIGSQGGLIRYDGYEFTPFRHDEDDPHSLDDNLVRIIYQGSNNQLWVGTMMGVNLYDSSTDRFTHYKKPPNTSNSFLGVTSMVKYDNRMIIGTERGLFELDLKNNAIISFTNQAPTGNSDEPISQLLVTQDNTLLIATRYALYSKAHPNEDFQVKLRAKNDEAIVGVFEDMAGKIWCRWSNGAIDVIKSKNTVKKGFRLEPSEKLAGYFPSWEAMVQPNYKEIWVGTNTGIVVLDSITGKTKKPYAETKGPVKSLLVDKSGLVWAAIDGQGLGRHIPHPAFKLIHKGLGVTSIGAAAEVNGKIWIGTRGGGIYIFNPITNEFKHIDIAVLTNPMNAGFIREILPIAKSVWVATNYAGVFQFNFEGELLQRYTLAQGLPSNRIFSLESDSKGRVWVGTTDAGLAIIDPYNDEIKSIALPFEGPIPVIDIVIDSLGIAYIATASGFAIISTDGKIDKYNYEEENENSLSSNAVVSLLLDKKGRIWVGTRDGLNLMESVTDGAKATFRRFSTREGLQNSFIDGLLEGVDGEIWAAVGSGLARINAKTFEITPFGTADGVPQGGFWVGAHNTTSNGILMFAAKEGLLMVDPVAKGWNYMPKVVVTSVNKGGEVFRGTISHDIVFESDKRDFSVEFASLDFSAPDKNIYSYKLEGYDKNWTQVDSTHRIATYTNLDPENYTLKIKGTNRNLQWSNDQIAIPIIVLSAYYEEAWFHLILIVSALAFLYLIYLWRMSHIRRKQRDLEYLINTRTGDLEKLNACLEKSSRTDYLTSLPNRLGFIEMAKHQIKKCENNFKPLSIALCDIDHFKKYNDTYGHDFGDTVLIKFTQFLQDQMRELGFVARWGGEEFTFLFPETDLQSAYVIAEGVVRNLRKKRWSHKNIEFKIMITIGVCQIKDSMSLDDCIKEADDALYKGKRNGRGMVVANT